MVPFVYYCPIGPRHQQFYDHVDVVSRVNTAKEIISLNTSLSNHRRANIPNADTIKRIAFYKFTRVNNTHYIVLSKLNVTIRHNYIKRICCEFYPIAKDQPRVQFYIFHARA